MRKLIVIIGFFIILAGCNTPADKSAHTASLQDSLYDTAIENLNTTTEQLEAIRKEKDLFVKSLEDFEQQRVEYAQFWEANQIQSQLQNFTDWHRDITLRERNLEVRHALNVLAAHNQVMKRKKSDPNQTVSNPLPVGLSPAIP
jgi:hypothetical protein